LQDLSLGGCRLQIEGGGVASGERVEFSVDDIHGIEAEVRGVDGNGVHLKFSASGPQRARIAQLLATVRVQETADDVDLW